MSLRLRRYRKSGDGWVDPWGLPVRDPALVESLEKSRKRVQPYVAKLPSPHGPRNPGVKVAGGLTRKLRQLCARTKPGECVETEKIARACGVSATTILEIERGAFRKLRAVLPPSLLKEWREMLHSANKAA